MASPIQHQLTIDQTANGDNNNTASREGGMGPIIDSDGWYAIGPYQGRFEIDLIATDTPNFSAAVYKKAQDGTEVLIYGPITDWTNTEQVAFQDPLVLTHVKVKVSSYVSGTLNAFISVT